MNIHKCTCLCSLVDGIDKLRATIRIDGMVATMVGDEHLLQTIALCDSDSNAQHDAITERNHGRFHIIIGIMSFRNGIRSLQETTLEILVHKAQVDGNMLDTQSLTVHLGERYLLGIVIGTIVKTDTQSNLVFLVIEQGNAVHTAAHNYN